MSERLDGKKRKWGNGKQYNRLRDDGWTYYRLYADEAQNHYIGFMRCMIGEEDQYLMAADIYWSREAKAYQGRMRIKTPPANILRIQTK